MIRSTSPARWPRNSRRSSASRPATAPSDGRSPPFGIPIRTALAFETVRRRHAAFGNREYDDLAVIAPADVETWIAAQGDCVRPPTALFLRLAGGRP